jgi:hypothetical protein
MKYLLSYSYYIIFICIFSFESFSQTESSIKKNRFELLIGSNIGFPTEKSINYFFDDDCSFVNVNIQNKISFGLNARIGMNLKVISHGKRNELIPIIRTGLAYFTERIGFEGQESYSCAAVINHFSGSGVISRGNMNFIFSFGVVEKIKLEKFNFVFGLSGDFGASFLQIHYLHNKGNILYNNLYWPIEFNRTDEFSLGINLILGFDKITKNDRRIGVQFLVPVFNYFDNWITKMPRSTLFGQKLFENYHFGTVLFTYSFNRSRNEEN